MSNPAYVAVDWGTSSFRLWLIDEDGGVLAERRSGEGMTTAARAGFAGILDSHLSAVSAPAALPVVICGMAGARQGWVEAGYLDTPAALAAIPEAAVRVPDAARDVRILPGLAQRDPRAPDVMRGEETQLLGAMAGLGDGAHLVCMPGTHSKWVTVAGRSVERFATFMTGELFEAISKQTILAHSIGESGKVDGTSSAFRDAVAEAKERPALFTNRLFSIRAGNLLHGLGETEACARLSGLLIGLEIAGAVTMAGTDAAVALVASGALGDLYAAALAAVDFRPATIDADAAVRSGLASAAAALWH